MLFTKGTLTLFNFYNRKTNLAAKTTKVASIFKSLTSNFSVVEAFMSIRVLIFLITSE